MPPDTPVPPTTQDGPGSMDEIYEQVRAIGKENERILGNLIAGENRFRSLAKAAWQVQENERRRLARELHDGIGQTLTALKNQLEWMERSQTNGALAPAKLRDAVELASQALEDTRELSRLLRPPVLDDLGLAAALKWLGRTASKRFGLTVNVETDELDERLAAELETVLFRIAQEALTNVAKHAGAEETSIRLTRLEREVELTVTDDGAGFDVDLASRADDGTGVGLRGMRDRVELFEGRFEIRSSPGAGTSVRTNLPIAPDDKP